MVGMDTPMRLSTLTHDLDTQQKAAAAVAVAVCSDSYLCDDITRGLRQRGFGRFVKAAVSPALASDSGIDDAPFRAAFLMATDARSLLGPLRARGAVSFPLGDGVRVQVREVFADHVSEAAPKRVSPLVFEFGAVVHKIQATIVMSDDLLRAVGPGDASRHHRDRGRRRREGERRRPSGRLDVGCARRRRDAWRGARRARGARASGVD